MTGDLFLGAGATFSADGRYRYHLWRRWAPLPSAVWIMLNPSTADATADDPTIRRCMGFARSWGCGGIDVLNLFAFRATEPAEMKAAADPIGPDNAETYRRVLGEFSPKSYLAPVVAAWGAHGTYLDRGEFVRRMLDSLGVRLSHLGLTKAGCPRHPLYLPAKLNPVHWPFNGGASNA